MACGLPWLFCTLGSRTMCKARREPRWTNLVCPSLVHFLVILPPNIPTTYTQHCKISRFTFCWFNWKLCQMKFYIVLIGWRDKWINSNKNKSKHFFFMMDVWMIFQFCHYLHNKIKFLCVSVHVHDSQHRAFGVQLSLYGLFHLVSPFLTHWALRTRTQLKLNKVMTIQQKPHTRHSPFPLFLSERRLNHK